MNGHYPSILRTSIWGEMPKAEGLPTPSLPCSHNMPDLHLSLPLHLDASARLALEEFPYQGVRVLCDLDDVRLPMRLHPAGGVHRISPQIISELPVPDHPGHDRPRVDPDSQAQLPAREGMLAEVVAHLQRHAGESLGMIEAFGWHARRRH